MLHHPITCYIIHFLKIPQLHVLYVLNINAIFHVNWMLFAIQSINSYFMQFFKLQKLKFKQLIDEMTINL